MPHKSHENVPLVSTHEAAHERNYVNPEEHLLARDHRGVAVALSLLTPMQRKSLCREAGLTLSGEPMSREGAARELDVTPDSVRKHAANARRILASMPNILDIISGEAMPPEESIKIQARYTREGLYQIYEEHMSPVDYAIEVAAHDAHLDLERGISRPR